MSIVKFKTINALYPCSGTVKFTRVVSSAETLGPCGLAISLLHRRAPTLPMQPPNNWCCSSEPSSRTRGAHQLHSSCPPLAAYYSLYTRGIVFVKFCSRICLDFIDCPSQSTTSSLIRNYLYYIYLDLLNKSRQIFSALEESILSTSIASCKGNSDS